MALCHYLYKCQYMASIYNVLVNELLHLLNVNTYSRRYISMFTWHSSLKFRKDGVPCRLAPNLGLLVVIFYINISLAHPQDPREA